MGDDDSAIKSINLKPGTHYVSNLEPRTSFLHPRAWGNQQRVTRNEKPILTSFLAFLRLGVRPEVGFYTPYGIF